MTAQAIDLAAAGRNVTFTTRALHFARRNVLFVLGATLFLAIVLAAVFAPLIAPYDPTAINFADKLSPPGAQHLMGTNELGQDIFSQVLFGARTSLLVGVVVISLAIAIGVPIGLVAGYFGGRLDTALMRFSDVFLAFPPLLLPIAITAALGSGLFNAMMALAVSWFPWYSRIVRGAVMRVNNELYSWWTVGFPGLAIFVTVLAVNLVGDGVRDTLDPKHQSSH